jgi:hypothetical protein
MRILPSFFTLDFALLCLSSFLFFASFNMIIPELPAYLSSLGGEEYKGLIIALFTVSAGLSRPFSGKLADKIGRIPVMVFGALVSFFSSLLYPVLATVSGFLFLRFLHGFSTGFTPTGTSAYVADIVPFQRRGEAMGIQSLFGSLGMAAGPALGGYIGSIWGIQPLFYASAATSILSILILVRLKETVTDKEPFQPGLLRLNRHEIIEKRVLTPSLILFLAVFSFGIVLTITPDFSEHLGIANKGFVFRRVYTLVLGYQDRGGEDIRQIRQDSSDESGYFLYGHFDANDWVCRFEADIPTGWGDFWRGSRDELTYDLRLDNRSFVGSIPRQSLGDDVHCAGIGNRYRRVPFSHRAFQQGRELPFGFWSWGSDSGFGLFSIVPDSKRQKMPILRYLTDFLIVHGKIIINPHWD